MHHPIRKTFLQLHRWSGMTIGLVIVWIAVTGASMAFRPQVEPIVRKDLFAVAPCTQRASLDLLTQNAQAAHPGAKLGFVRVFSDPGQPTRISFTDKEAVYLDPCTGDVLGKQGRFNGPFGTLEKLHTLEFIEKGDLITGISALAFALLIVPGGIFLWWPRRVAAIGPSLRFDSRLEGRKGTLNKHKVIGIYAALIVLTSALTALPQAFGWYKDGLYWITGTAKPAPKPKSALPKGGATPLSMQAHWQQVQSVVPNPAQALLHYPKKPADAVEAFVIPHDAPHANARTWVYLDAYTGKVVGHRPYAESGLGNKLYYWCLTLHHGEFLGFFGQLLMFLGALAMPFMAYTGISSYLRRRAAPAEPAEPATLRVRVAKVRTEAADIKSFELVSADARPLPPFSPGAHVSVHIAQDLVRQYSLCNDPTEAGRYRIAVKRVSDSRGGSQAMHEQVAENDVLTIDPPRNHFPLETRAKHHVLLAAGIGITPLLAMANHLARSGASFELHYFTRGIEQTAFHAELAKPFFAGKVSFYYAVERERMGEHLNKLLWHRRKGAHLYLCGPAPFMDLVKSKAVTWAPETIHIEYFNADPSASSGPRTEFEVSLALAGGTYKVPADKSILQVLTERGVKVAKSCEQGICGTCLTGVLEGTPDHRDAFLSNAERKACHKMLLCVSRAKTPRLVLDM